MTSSPQLQWDEGCYVQCTTKHTNKLAYKFVLVYPNILENRVI